MIPGRTLKEEVQNHLGQARSESYKPNGASEPRRDIEDIDRALEPSDTGPTRREFLGPTSVFLATMLSGCGSYNSDKTGTEREVADTPAQDTAEPADEETEAEVVETPEETPEPDNLLDDLNPYHQKHLDILERYGVDSSVADDSDIEDAMREGVQEAGCSPPYLDKDRYLNSGAVHAWAKAMELSREENPDTTQEALGLHRIKGDVKRVFLGGKEADIAVVEDTQENETYLATNVDLELGEEGSDAAVYRVGTEPEGTTQELLKELTNPDKVGSGTSVDWESWREAVEQARDYDEEDDARYLSKLLGDIVAGASVTHDKIYNSTEDVPYPMLWTHEFHKELSEGPSLGLIDGVEEITNEVAETDRASSEIYVLTEGGEVVATEYEFSDGIPQDRDEI